MLSFARKMLLSRLALPAIRVSYPLRTQATMSAAAVNIKGENSIMVNWNKKKDSWSKYHFDWLRDNCPCTKCRHPGYNQRLLNTLEDATPTSVEVEDSGTAVEVKWRDGHRSQYLYEWLLANSYCHNNISKPAKPGEDKIKEITLWDHKMMVDPPQVNYNDMMTNDDSLLTMLRGLHQYGFCFVLGAPPTEESMKEAANRVGPFKNGYFGGQQWVMKSDILTIEHVSFGTGKVLPHTDDPVYFEPPGMTWLHVLAYENAEGAGTRIMDAFNIAYHVKQHNPEYYALLSRVPIPYEIMLKDCTYRKHRKTFILDDDDELLAVSLNHIDRRPLDEKSLAEARKVLSCGTDEAMKKMYGALRYLHEVMYSNQYAYTCDLRPGVLAAVNNWRVFHSRDALIKGYRKVCGMHHNREDWMSKLLTLERLKN